MRQAALAGFWIRVLAHLIDLFWMVPLSIILGLLGDFVQGGRMTIGGEIMASVVVGLVVLLFWVERQGPPGKLVLGLRIIDAATGGLPPVGRLITRYIGYVVSALPVCLGYLWMLWDGRKQTWHDKMGGTLVVRLARPGSV